MCQLFILYILLSNCLVSLEPLTLHFAIEYLDVSASPDLMLNYPFTAVISFSLDSIIESAIFFRIFGTLLEKQLNPVVDSTEVRAVFELDIILPDVHKLISIG